MFPANLVTLADLDRSQIVDLFELSEAIKQSPRNYRDRLAGRSLAMIFQKPSTRTRVSFEVGMAQLGGSSVALTRQDMQLKRGETVADTARVLSAYVDAIAARLFDHSDLVTLAQESSVPVINALTNDLHPCQALADYFTIYELFGRVSGIKMAYVGDGNNMAHSLMIGAAILGVDLAIASPADYTVADVYRQQAEKLAQASSTRLSFFTDPAEAVVGVDVVYTDVWTSMGQEEESAHRRLAFADYCVDEAMMAQAGSDAVFLHCLPLHRGEEVSAAVADGPQSRIWQQAENRLHVQKALLVRLIDRQGD